MHDDAFQALNKCGQIQTVHGWPRIMYSYVLRNKNPEIIHNYRQNFLEVFQLSKFSPQ